MAAASLRISFSVSLRYPCDNAYLALFNAGGFFCRLDDFNIVAWVVDSENTSWTRYSLNYGPVNEQHPE